jgi:hypothetical protein
MPVIHLPPTFGDAMKLAYGEHTTVAAADTIATGLTTVLHAVATLRDDPVAGAQHVSAVPGSNGQITIKSWKATATADTALIAGTTFAKKVNWVCVGS